MIGVLLYIHFMLQFFFLRNYKNGNKERHADTKGNLNQLGGLSDVSSQNRTSLIGTIKRVFLHSSLYNLDQPTTGK